MVSRSRRPGLDQEQHRDATEQGEKNGGRWVTGWRVTVCGSAVVAGQSGGRWDDWRQRIDEGERLVTVTGE